MPAPEAGRRALGHLDAVLAERPTRNGHELSAALRCLAAYRETLRAAAGQDPERAGTKLGHVNAVISVVMAMQFPLGESPWAELAKARGWLAASVEADGG